MKKKFLVIPAVFVAVSMIFAACSPSVTDTGRNNSIPESGSVGTILLSVNPEIEIDYNNKGIVIEIEGKNDEGKKIVAGYKDFSGKSCEQVTQELVQKIYDSGYIVNDAEGNPKNIIVKLEEGSKYPSEEFLQAVAQSVRSVVSNQGSKSNTMVISNKDLDKNGLIGLEKAKEIVLAQLGFPEAEFTEKEYELDDGKYELEFKVNGIEYDYEVDARTGKILKIDIDDDRYDKDYDDDDDKNPASSDKITASEFIGIEKAKQIVFDKLGIKESSVYDKDFELDGKKYEIDFSYNGFDYEYEVDAISGKILKAEKEIDD